MQRWPPCQLAHGVDDRRWHHSQRGASRHFRVAGARAAVAIHVVLHLRKRVSTSQQVQAVAYAPSKCRLLLTDCRTADEYCGPNPYSTLREMVGLVQIGVSAAALAPDTNFRVVVVDEGPVPVLLEPEV